MHTCDLLLCQLPPAVHVLVARVAKLLQHVLFLDGARTARLDDLLCLWVGQVQAACRDAGAGSALEACVGAAGLTLLLPTDAHALPATNHPIKHPHQTHLAEDLPQLDARHVPLAVEGGWQVREEDADGAHAIIQVMKQVGDLRAWSCVQGVMVGVVIMREQGCVCVSRRPQTQTGTANTQQRACAPGQTAARGSRAPAACAPP